MLCVASYMIMGMHILHATIINAMKVSGEDVLVQPLSRNTVVLVM